MFDFLRVRNYNRIENQFLPTRLFGNNITNVTVHFNRFVKLYATELNAYTDGFTCNINRTIMFKVYDKIKRSPIVLHYFYYYNIIIVYGKCARICYSGGKAIRIERRCSSSGWQESCIFVLFYFISSWNTAVQQSGRDAKNGFHASVRGWFDGSGHMVPLRLSHAMRNDQKLHLTWNKSTM